MHAALPLFAATGFPSRRLASVDWQGYLYDCDFNQMRGLPGRLDGASRRHLRDLLRSHPAHGCTAGQGSI